MDSNFKFEKITFLNFDPVGTHSASARLDVFNRNMVLFFSYQKDKIYLQPPAPGNESKISQIVVNQ